MQRCQDIPELPRHIVVIMDRNDGPRYLKIQSCQSYSTRKIVHSGRHVHLLVRQCLLTPCESFLKLKVIIKWHWTSLPQSTQPAAHELLRTWLLLGGCQLPLLWMLPTATAQTIWPSTRTSKTTQWGPTAQVQRKHSESQAQAIASCPAVRLALSLQISAWRTRRSNRINDWNGRSGCDARDLREAQDDRNFTLITLIHNCPSLKQDVKKISQRNSVQSPCSLVSCMAHSTASSLLRSADRKFEDTKLWKRDRKTERLLARQVVPIW